MTGQAAWVDLILKRAAELRAAGVLTISVEGCSATLAPPPPDTSDGKSKRTGAQKLEAEKAELGPDYWNDPASYPQGIVPGFKIEKLAPEED